MEEIKLSRFNCYLKIYAELQDYGFSCDEIYETEEGECLLTHSEFKAREKIQSKNEQELFHLSYQELDDILTKLIENNKNRSSRYIKEAKICIDFYSMNICTKYAFNLDSGVAELVYRFLSGNEFKELAYVKFYKSIVKR